MHTKAAFPIMLLFSVVILAGCASQAQNALVLPPMQAVIKNNPDVSQVGLYNTLPNQPTSPQLNPLTAIANFHFGPNVQTVGQAVNQVLSETGFSMVPLNQLPEEAQSTLLKPLPITQRSLGPVSVAQALNVLMGANVFTLEVDPVNRLIAVSVRKDFIPLPPEYEAKVLNGVVVRDLSLVKNQ